MGTFQEDLGHAGLSAEVHSMPTTASDTTDSKSKRIKVLGKSRRKRNAKCRQPYHLKRQWNSISKKKSKSVCGNKENEIVEDDDFGGAMALLEGMWSDTNASLESKAKKSKLSTRNVKTIIRHVISNEHVIKMVRNTLLAETGNQPNLEEAEFVPRLTRSKVKDLHGTSQFLQHGDSPVKLNDGRITSVQLLMNKSCDGVGTSDVQPDGDETEYESEEEEEENSGILPASKDDADSPLPKEPSPEKLSTDHMDKECTLMIAAPSLNTTDEFGNQVPDIALRTRSKLPLHDTPLEEIEAAFVAPDISVDMYDTECDNPDWISFLQNFANPKDSIVETGPDEPHDDDGDPDYNFLEEADMSNEEDEKWEKRDDKAVQVPMKELRELLQEPEEIADQGYVYSREEQCSGDDDDDEERSPESQSQVLLLSPTKDQILYPENCFQLLAQSMTQEQKLQLQEQMRMHVQLLCQTYLLAVAKPIYENYGSYAKFMLDELDFFSSRELPIGNESFFSAHNLQGAVEIVHSTVSVKSNSRVRENPGKKYMKSAIGSEDVKKIMAFNKTFMYPELLPRGGFQSRIVQRKCIYTKAEDNLIALGLEQTSSFSPRLLRYYVISKLLLPMKTEHQIKWRVDHAKLLKHSPVHYYFTHNKAPSFSRSIRPFDPNDIKTPAEVPSELLPPWMVSYLENYRQRSARRQRLLSRRQQCVQQHPKQYPRFVPKYNMRCFDNLRKRISKPKGYMPISRQVPNQKNVVPNLEIQASTSDKLLKPDQCLSESSEKEKQCSPYNPSLRERSPGKISKKNVVPNLEIQASTSDKLLKPDQCLSESSEKEKQCSPYNPSLRERSPGKISKKNVVPNLEIQASTSDKLLKPDQCLSESSEKEKQCSPYNPSLRERSPGKISKEFHCGRESSFSNHCDRIADLPPKTSSMKTQSNKSMNLSYQGAVEGRNLLHMSFSKKHRKRNRLGGVKMKELDFCGKSSSPSCSSDTDELLPEERTHSMQTCSQKFSVAKQKDVQNKSLLPTRCQKRYRSDDAEEQDPDSIRESSLSRSGSEMYEPPPKRTCPVPKQRKGSNSSNQGSVQNSNQLHKECSKRCKPDDANEQTEENSKGLADEYVMEVVNVLKEEPERLERFLLTLASFEEETESYDNLYEEMKEILSMYPSLLERFSLFKP